MPLRPLLPGDPLQVGKFVLDGRLGVGGMGVVFRGHTADGTPAAVKLVREEIAADPDFRTRFRREIRAARAVGGVCTARLLDADAEAQRPWLAVEFVDGPTLADVVVAHGPLPPPAAHALAAGLAEALVAIHAAGVVHRDLKPANVLLGPHGPKVIDFGIAALATATSPTRTGMVFGSPGYMAPEQITGTGSGPATDVFAWGLTVAFAATGRAPFGASERAEVLLYRAVHGTPDLAGLPAALDATVRAAVAPDPARRPRPDDLMRLLLPDAADPYQAATTVLRQVWPGVAALRPARRQGRRRTALLVAAVAVLVAAGAGGWWFLDPGQPGTTVAQPTIASTTTPTTTTAPPTTTAAPVPAVPRFAGPVDDPEPAGALGQFLSDNDGGVVYLDIYQSVGTNPFEGGTPANPDYMTVTDTYCDTEPPQACGGTQLVVNDAGPATDSLFFHNRGILALRGYFSVTVVPNSTNMGITPIQVRAVPLTAVNG